MLDFMVSVAVDGSDKIAGMRASQSISWDDLENHPRRLEIIKKLQELDAK